MAGDLGKVLVRYGVDTSELDASTTRIQGTFSSLKSSVLSGAGIIMGAAGVGGMVMSAKKAVDAYMDFGDALNQSFAIMGDLSEETRQQMADVARDMALNSRYSAAEVANAYYYLASAGLDAAQTIAALPAAVQFAQAGMVDLATATDYLVNAQAALGLTVEDANQNLENMKRVSDVITQANNLATGSVQEFAEALNNKAAPAMRELGMEVEEGMAVLMAYANVGVKGATAGEQFYMVLRDLQRAARENKDEFAKYNISVYDAEGNFRNFADILGELETALAGMSDEQRGATLAQLGFQERSMAALKTIMGMSGQIREYESALRSAGGATEQVASKQMESLEAKWEKLKKQLIEFGMDIMEAVEPVISAILKMVDALGGAGNALMLLGGAWASVKVISWVNHLNSAAGAAAGVQLAFSGMGAAAQTGVAGIKASLTSGLQGLTAPITATASSIGSAIAGGIVAGFVGYEIGTQINNIIKGIIGVPEAEKGEKEAQERAAAAEKMWSDQLAASKAAISQTAAANRQAVLSTAKDYEQVVARMREMGYAGQEAADMAVVYLSDQALAVEALNLQYIKLQDIASEPTLTEELRAAVLAKAEAARKAMVEVMALSGQLSGLVSDAIKNLAPLPWQVLEALQSANPQVQEAGRNLVAQYTSALAEMSGMPPEQAAQVAAQVAAALRSSDPAVRQGAMGTIDALLQGLIAKGALPPEQAGKIRDAIASALGVTPPQQNDVVTKYKETMDRIRAAIDAGGKSAADKAAFWGDKIWAGIANRFSPDISEKAPALYEQMFDNLDTVFARRMPGLALSVGAITMPEVQAPASPTRIEQHYHIGTLIADERSMEELARKLEYTYRPRVTRGVR